MNSVWSSLLWKEWREHRWKLAALVAIIVLVPVIASLRHPETFFGGLSAVFVLAIPLGSMFVAMNLAAGEQSKGTIKFLQALPISPSRPAAAKLLWGALTVVIPVLLGVAVAWMWTALMSEGAAAEAIAFDRDMYQSSWLIESWYGARAAGGALGAISILLWIAAAGVNRSDEVQAAAVGLLVVASSWAALTYLGYIAGADGGPPHWWYVLSAGAPGGAALTQPGAAATEWAKYIGKPGALWPFVLVALCSHTALGAWFIARYGRAVAGRPASLQTSPVVQKSWLAPPRPGPLSAMIWQQARLSAPLAAALAIAILVTSAIFAGYANRHDEGNVAIEVLFISSCGAWAATGLCAAIPAGIAVFLEDLQPRMHSFWRSRPVSVDQWFLVKFLTGLLLPVLILPLPVIATFVLFVASGEPLPPDFRGLLEAGVGFLIAHIGLFCTAVLMIILVRQAAYAAILTVAAAGLFLSGIHFIAPRGTEYSVAAAAVVATVAVTALAWLALRKDWGWSP
jgi:ABC-type transport system involved in multi-copper enzyme maturation permease subunit